jgi:ATP-dependent Lhr-like helicase
VAQQLLALTLQEHRIGLRTWTDWWHGLAPMASDGQEVLDFLVSEGFLDTDGGLAFIGPAAEKHFGRRHFLDLMAVFTAAPEFTVIAGREGSVRSATTRCSQTRLARPACCFSLAGRGW